MDIIVRGRDMVNSTYGNNLSFLKLGFFLNCNPAPFKTDKIRFVLPSYTVKNTMIREKLEPVSCIYNIR